MSIMAAPKSGLDSTPICRCRVLYLGSAVPHVTKDGLQGIQEPLRELYPEQGAIGARGIDSWLSVWSNGILLENVDENHKKVTRFFPIDSLHYCAAVRYVLVPEKSAVNSTTQPRFLPLDSPFARSPNPNHPPLFACILRRTTGIKVLECHTFICKREMAANALVRCCFHAYADSAYAKHLDNGTSLYGTLNRDIISSTNSIEKVEGWRRMASPSGPGGSTLTLESAVHTIDAIMPTNTSNSADDISIYDGDVNHKVWTGSTKDVSAAEEAIYGEYASTMRSSRSARPRQIVNATPPPPPPPNEPKAKTRKVKEKPRRSKTPNGSREEIYGMNGTLMRPSTAYSVGYPSSFGNFQNHQYPNGTLLRPNPVMMVSATLPRPPRNVMSGTTGRPPKGMILVPPPRPLAVGPPPPPPMPPVYFQMHTGKKNKHFRIPAAEEPVYMPSTRPLSPVSSYQPCHFPYEAYLMQQYANADHKNKDGRSKKNKKGIPPPMPLVFPETDDWSEAGIYMHKRMKDEYKNGKLSSHSLNIDCKSMGGESEEVPFEVDIYNKKNRQNKKLNGFDKASSSFHSESNRKKAKNIKKMNGISKHEDEDNSVFNSGMYGMKNNKEDKKSNGVNKSEEDEEDGSPFNTGIYRRKGHLNERAFSYSIRQEHRSRSYGSLANLKFAPVPVVPNGVGISNDHYDSGTISKEDMKKEREIMQMMQDLELSGDEIERSQVPVSVYQEARQRQNARR